MTKQVKVSRPPREIQVKVRRPNIKVQIPATYIGNLITTEITDQIIEPVVMQEAVSQYDLVRIQNNNGFIANALDGSHTHQAKGLATNAAGIGQSVNVLTFGTIENPGWNWDETRPLLLGMNGMIVQFPSPGSQFHLNIGEVLSPQKIQVNFKEVVLYGN